MATGQGTLTFDFGSAPGSNVAQAVDFPSGLSATSKVEIYLMGTDSTATHNAYEHQLLPLGGLSVQATTVGTNTLIAEAMSLLRLTGTFTARYVWAD